MALSLYEIKGTDPISGSRLMINDNFKLVENEINLFENYIDLSLGIISGLSRLSSSELLIGTNKLIIDSATLELNNTYISLIGEVSISGNIITENINTTSINNTNYPTLSFTIGSTVDSPPYYIYRISNSAGSNFDVLLHAGKSGQSILFVYENNTSGIETPVLIKNATTSTGVIYIGTNNYIKLSNIGDAVEMKFIEDGWYIISGHNFILE